MALTPERSAFLKTRFKAAAKTQPDIPKLRRVLLALGGEMLVAPPNADPLIPELIEFGFVFSSPVAMRAGRASECHANVARLWAHKRRFLCAIGTGYALSEDGLWRQHSWGISRTRIIETTVPRVAYFGLAMFGERADVFAVPNLG